MRSTRPTIDHQQPHEPRDDVDPSRHERRSRDDDPLVAVVVGKLADEPRRDRRHLALRLLDRDAVLQPAAHHQPDRAPRRQPGRTPRHRLRRHRDRQPQVGAEQRRALEAARRDANDRERVAVEENRLADDSRIRVVPALPQLVADHRHRAFPRRPIVSILERPAVRRARAEHGEVIAADDRAEHALRGVTPPKAHRRRLEPSGIDAVERRRALAHRAVERMRHRVKALAALRPPEVDQPIRRRQPRQGSQQERVGDRENRGVCANPNREGEGGRQSEEGAFPEEPKGKADVLEECLEHGGPRCTTSAFVLRGEEHSGSRTKGSDLTPSVV